MKTYFANTILRHMATSHIIQCTKPKLSLPKIVYAYSINIDDKKFYLSCMCIYKRLLYFPEQFNTGKKDELNWTELGLMKGCYQKHILKYHIISTFC